MASPAVANGVVYVATGGPPPRVFLPIRSHGHLPARDGPSPRGQAAGSLTAGTGSLTAGIDAFSATCATGGDTCSPLWQGSGGSYYSPSGPVVAGGELWGTGGPHNGPADLYAFGLPVP